MSAEIISIRKRRGPTFKSDGRSAFALFPKSRGYDLLYLYAFGLADGRTKIGVTCKPRHRLLSHWKAHNGTIVWSHLFSALPGRSRSQVQAVETKALLMAASVSKRIGNTEMFIGLSKAVCIDCVRKSIQGYAPEVAKAA